MKYKIISENAAPSYYDLETGNLVYEENDAFDLAFWVCSWDEEQEEVFEWVERFDTVAEAQKYIKKLEERK